MIKKIKSLFLFVFAATTIAFTGGCSTNPATGQSQFTALMSPQQETQVGAQEHEKIAQTFGLLDSNDPVQKYVEALGQKLAVNTERPDVKYRFFVLDNPIVNAFALPGGYVYVSRGLLAQADSEAELAAVISHEIGHVTARHSAERYSQGVLTSLGAMAVGLAVKNPDAGRMANLGSQLFMSSYSRSQENEADELGIRYLGRAGYDERAMASFLHTLKQGDDLDRKISGKSGGGFSFFSTHPQTQERVQLATAMAANYQPGGIVARDNYLSVIDGLVYGDSRKQGFARGHDFYHPDMGFTFSVPSGFQIHNSPDSVVAVSSQSDAVVVFDAASNKGRQDPYTYLRDVWLKGEAVSDLEKVTVNGMSAATASFNGKVNGQAMTVRMVAVAWDADTLFRFQIAIPKNASATLLDNLKSTTYSLRRMTESEIRTVQPYYIGIVTAKSGNTIGSLASDMPFESYKEDRFRVLNGLQGDEQVVAGEKYKIVRD